MYKVRNDRINSIDSIKAVAAILVVVQHALALGNVNSFVFTLARVSVPFFMIITGFLFLNCYTKKAKIPVKEVYYHNNFNDIVIFSFDLLTEILKHCVSYFLISLFSFDDIFRFLVFKDPVFADHTWYMWSMNIVLLAVMFFPVLNNNKVVRYTIIISGTLSTLIFGKYSIMCLGNAIPRFYTRLAWSVGFPYFLIGITLGEKR